MGGGSALIDSTMPLKGASRVCKPQHYQVANAVGAALSQVSGTEEVVRDLTSVSREVALQDAIQKAKDEALWSGADPDTLQVGHVLRSLGSWHHKAGPFKQH